MILTSLDFEFGAFVFLDMKRPLNKPFKNYFCPKNGKFFGF